MLSARSGKGGSALHFTMWFSKKRSEQNIREPFPGKAEDCCHFSQRFRSWSVQLNLLFTEVLPQDYNYRFCLAIKKVWILHQRMRKQLTQRCGVNLSHSLLDGIPVVCMDSGQRMSPWGMGSSELMVGKKAPALLCLSHFLEKCWRWGKQESPMLPPGQLPPRSTSLCS